MHYLILYACVDHGTYYKFYFKQEYLSIHLILYACVDHGTYYKFYLKKLKINNTGHRVLY